MLISDDRANRLWHAIISEAALGGSGYHITALNIKLAKWIKHSSLALFLLTNTLAHFLCLKSRCSTGATKHHSQIFSGACKVWVFLKLGSRCTDGDPHWGSCILIYHDQLGAAQTWDGSMSQELTFVSVYWPRFIDFVVTPWLDFNFQRWNLTKYRRNLVSQGSETEIGEFTSEQNIADLSPLLQ